MSPARRPPATVCGHPLHASAHICAFFDSEQQEYACLVPYFAEGLALGEQVVTIRDAGHCSTHTAKLRESGAIPVDEAIRANRLRVMASEETYLLDGVFEVERMYRMIEKALVEAKAEGYSRVRTCGEMSWALRDMPGTDDLMEYESRVNELTQQHDCTLMCTYDISRISGRALMDVLATHPIVLLGDRIYENPYYQKPVDFLKNMLQRSSVPLKRLAETEPA